MKNKKNKNRFSAPLISQETKRSILAICFWAISLFLVLAKKNQAGPVGDFFALFLEKFFGLGYWLFPLIFFFLGLIFLTSHRQKIYFSAFLGGLIFVFAGLGLIDVIFPQKSGIIGQLIGFLEIPFGYWASVLILSAVLISSCLIIFNLSIKLPKIDFVIEKIKLLFGFLFQRKSKTLPEETIEIKEPDYDKENKKLKDESEKIPEKDLEETTEKDKTLKKEKDEKLTEPEQPEQIKDYLNIKKILPLKGKKIKELKFENYNPPPVDLLSVATNKPTAGDLRANANIIKRTLESFGIPVEMGEINIGPKVTRYTLKPAEGVKLSKITALSSDLALALAAHPIRIEAPIPGKSLVGIEVPNKTAALVRLGSLIRYQEFKTCGFLCFALGRDVCGEPVFVDIEKMPHLLIAGSTGSGKSITIHTLLISLLYKNSPDKLKLVLIDPKRVELSVYNNLPHLIAPVITDTKKSLNVFRWAIEEMDKRYQLLMESGSRDIQSYNQKNKQEPLPYVLILIDELADLMTTYGKEVEGAIVRLAQMARATGIHLIVSTQRPSVEIITGLIKANITSRIALKVASQIDSRTILDTAGAEKLLGKGDMLFISKELSKPKRIQGAYITEDEIKKVVNFIIKNNQINQTYQSEELLKEKEQPPFVLTEDVFEKYNNNNQEQEEDELFNQAVEVVKQAKKASASLLQRRLKIGYARAARLLDIMEEKGIVGPQDGAKPREVFIVDENE